MVFSSVAGLSIWFLSPLWVGLQVPVPVEGYFLPAQDTCWRLPPGMGRCTTLTAFAFHTELPFTRSLFHTCHSDAFCTATRRRQRLASVPRVLMPSVHISQLPHVCVLHLADAVRGHRRSDVQLPCGGCVGGPERGWPRCGISQCSRGGLRQRARQVLRQRLLQDTVAPAVVVCWECMQVPCCE